ncbi:MAG: hypothetical protein ACOCX5_05905 [Chloroflexota bacterium]
MPQFDYVILLSAPAELITQRLKDRSNNPYGRQADEVARVLDLKNSVEPLLQRPAGHAIITTRSLQDVVDEIVEIIEHDQAQVT